MADLQGLVEEGIAQGLYLGATFRVLRGGETVAEGSVGLAQDDPAVPASSDTIWDLASLTKPVATATSVLILAEEGRFHLDEELQSLLPGESPSLAGITIRHCLTHVSGLKPWEQLHSRGHRPAEAIAVVRKSERSRPPGTGYAYSDLNYILLGELIRAVSGQSVAEFARERIFQPLGMSDTGYLPSPERHARIAATRCPDRRRVLVGEVHDGNCHTLGGVAGHAGLFGTAADLLTYAQMVLRGGSLNGRRILGPLAVAQIGQNQNPSGVNGHTLGWFTRPNGYLPAGDFLPPDTFGHTGFTGTSLLLCPSLNLAVVLLTNRVYMQRDAAEFIRFRRRFHDAVAALVV